MEYVYYSPEQAALQAKKFCEENQGWKRICDIPDSDKFYMIWDELPEKTKKYWIEEYGRHHAKNAWLEFGEAKCKVPFGHVSGKGKFYPNYTFAKAPLGENGMMVFKVDEYR